MQKIIHLVLGKANPHRMNGVNKVAHHHAEYLHKLGYDVEIWGITHSPTSPVIDRQVKTRLFRSQYYIRGLDPALMMAIEQLQPKVLFHIHGALIREFYLITKILVEKNISYVYTPHGAFNEAALKKNTWIKKLYIDSYEKPILKNAKKVHFLGQSEYDHITKIVRLNNKVIIPNGQCFEELKFEYKSVDREKEPVFGFCGRLDIYYKGLDVLIESFTDYINKNGQGLLWLIGDSPERKKLEQKVIANNISNKVVFYGAKYGEEKLNLIANMDVFVHPSRSEGSPTAVLEAAALNRPLLVTTGTNIGELVDQYNAGLHIKKLDVESIRLALHDFEKMFHNDQLKPLGNNAASMVKDNFDWIKIAQQLSAVYES